MILIFSLQNSLNMNATICFTDLMKTDWNILTYFHYTVGYEVT